MRASGAQREQRAMLSARALALTASRQCSVRSNARALSVALLELNRAAGAARPRVPARARVPRSPQREHARAEHRSLIAMRAARARARARARALARAEHCSSLARALAERFSARAQSDRWSAARPQIPARARVMSAAWSEPNPART